MKIILVVGFVLASSCFGYAQTDALGDTVIVEPLEYIIHDVVHYAHAARVTYTIKGYEIRGVPCPLNPQNRMGVVGTCAVYHTRQFPILEKKRVRYKGKDIPLNSIIGK